MFEWFEWEKAGGVDGRGFSPEKYFLKGKIFSEDRGRPLIEEYEGTGTRPGKATRVLV